MPVNMTPVVKDAKVTTGEVRFSYLHVLEPHAVRATDTPRYSVQLLIPKTEEGELTVQAIREAAKNAYDATAARRPVMPKFHTLKSTLHDCDEEDDTESHPERAGHYRMTVSAKADRAPVVVDSRLQAITDKSKIWSGCYGRVNLGAFYFDVQGNRAISFGLNSLQMSREGEPLGAVTPANGGFTPLTDDGEVEGFGLL